MLGGDFSSPGWNWRDKILKSGSPTRGSITVMDTFNDLGFQQLVELPTRGENNLDLMLTNYPSLFPRIENIPGASSIERLSSHLRRP